MKARDLRSSNRDAMGLIAGGSCVRHEELLGDVHGKSLATRTEYDNSFWSYPSNPIPKGLHPLSRNWLKRVNAPFLAGTTKCFGNRGTVCSVRETCDRLNTFKRRLSTWRSVSCLQGGLVWNIEILVPYTTNWWLFLPQSDICFQNSKTILMLNFERRRSYRLMLQRFLWHIFGNNNNGLLAFHEKWFFYAILLTITLTTNIKQR